MADWATGQAPPELVAYMAALAGVAGGPHVRFSPVPDLFQEDGWGWFGLHDWGGDIVTGPTGAFPIGESKSSQHRLVWHADGSIHAMLHDDVFESGFTGRGAIAFNSYPEMLSCIVELRPV